MKTILTKNLVGTAGEYYVCAELCMQGYLALLTPKNNPIFDVVATTQDGSRSVSIQVKTRSAQNTQGWKLGTDITKGHAPSSLFVVLVNLNASSLPDFYVYEYHVLSERVSKVYQTYISKPKRDGSAKKDVGFRWFDETSFNDDDRSRKNNWEPIIDALNPIKSRIQMHVSCFWRNCMYRGKNWGATPLDAFWVEATLAEAEICIFPKLQSTVIAESKELAEQSEDMAKQMGKTIRPYCFLITKDLSSIEPFHASYPFHHMWNANSPFESIPDLFISSLEELQDIELLPCDAASSNQENAPAQNDAG